MFPSRARVLLLAAALSPTVAQASAQQRVVPSSPVEALAHADVVATESGSSRHEFERVFFGDIPVELTLYASDRAKAVAAAEAAFARIAGLAAMMDDYALDPPSPLNRIAELAPQAVEIPDELLLVLRRGKEMHAITDGAFDITAKPFVQLWRVSRRLGELPPADRIRRAAVFVDIGALTLDRERSTAMLAREGMWLDLGGIAKGAIGDAVIALLSDLGVPSCRYHAGGDMVFGDAPPGLPGWPVRVPDLQVCDDAGVRRPLAFWASRCAASVSGDVFRFVEIHGVRYAHVIDPRTGFGVTTRRISCVRGAHGIDTDPLATAGLVLDDARWRAALRRVPGCEGWTAEPDEVTPRR
ncbi:MAG: FAD:protein FMN transferase [Planctomycetota bacterium]